MITDAQAETLRALETCHVINDELCFTPLEIFPARNNEDNGHRRTCSSLKRAGLLIDEPYQPGRLRPVADKIRAAYQEWYQKRGWKLDS